MRCSFCMFFFFFFNDTATTEIYTLSLHDALPILISPAACWRMTSYPLASHAGAVAGTVDCRLPISLDRKSTRLNSSHGYISYAVFCLKKKKWHTVRAGYRSGDSLSVTRCMYLRTH